MRKLYSYHFELEDSELTNDPNIGVFTIGCMEFSIAGFFDINKCQINNWATSPVEYKNGKIKELAQEFLTLHKDEFTK